MSRIDDRTRAFCESFGLELPILLAPMAGASAPSLSIAVAEAGGLGACGALLMQPTEIASWAATVRAGARGPFQLNVWIPDPEPVRDRAHEARVRAYLAQWGPVVDAAAADARPPDFDAQVDAMIAARPAAMSSVMGLYPARVVDRMRAAGIRWIANVSTVAEAKAASDAGADAVVVQGAEAGGHRGCFDAREAERGMVGLFSLVPTVVDAVRLPVIATGGIADGRGVAAALALGAWAVQIGTGFMRCPEARLAPAWADALARTAPEDTVVTRAFSGRAGRSIATAYVRASMGDDAPAPAPYPVQRALTAAMRAEAAKAGDLARMQVWAGQSASLARAIPAAELTRELWKSAQAILDGG